MSQFKPLLSATIEDTANLVYPVLVSTKLDGIRCIVIDGVACSRNLKPIRSAHVQVCIGKPEYNNLDGELIVGDPYAEDCFRKTSSEVMASDKTPDFTFHVFDRIDMPQFQFQTRLAKLPSLPYVALVPHWEVETEAELLEIEAELLAKGAEGVSEFFTDDADLLPPGYPNLKGPKAIEDFWKAAVAGAETVRLTTEEAVKQIEELTSRANQLIAQAMELAKVHKLEVRLDVTGGGPAGTYFPEGHEDAAYGAGWENSAC